jgi:hypothetical protein
MLLQLLQDASVPWDQRLSILTEEQVPAAAVPVAVLVNLVRSAQQEESNSGITKEPSLEHWVLQRWHQFTKQQVGFTHGCGTAA